MRPQPDLAPQRTLHFITPLPQAPPPPPPSRTVNPIPYPASRKRSIASATFVEFSTDSLIALPISRTISFASSSISILLVCYARQERLPTANCHLPICFLRPALKPKIGHRQLAIGNVRL